MVSKAKLYSKLDTLEAQLRDILLPHLHKAVAEKDDLIFCVKAFNQFRELKDRTDKVTEESIEIGSQILSLRGKLGEPTQGIIAERVCWYCREWSKVNNYHISTGLELAKQFLQEIENENCNETK